MKFYPFAGFLGTIICLVTALPSGATAQESGVPFTLPLWPAGKMPGRGPEGTEREMPSKGDGVVRLTDIHEPSISVFQAGGRKAPVPVVVICPGGGYNILAYNKEGTEIAAWLNSVGVTGIVLKYRVPGNREGALQDLQRAMRLVRQHAGQWNLDPGRIGVMGFSAGGHLCARLATHSAQPGYPRLDSADDQKAAPDFAVLVYPAYLASRSGTLAEELPVNAKTPPTFLVHTEDDKSFVAGSKVYHAALEAAGVRNQLFLPATGGHGYGLRAAGEVGVWPKKCQEWLAGIGVLPVGEGVPQPGTR